MKELIKVLQVLQTKCNAWKCDYERAIYQMGIDEMWNIVSGEEVSINDVFNSVKNIKPYLEPEDTTIFWAAMSKAKLTRQ